MLPKIVKRIFFPRHIIYLIRTHWFVDRCTAARCRFAVAASRGRTEPQRLQASWSPATNTTLIIRCNKHHANSQLQEQRAKNQVQQTTGQWSVATYTTSMTGCNKQHVNNHLQQTTWKWSVTTTTTKHSCNNNKEMIIWNKKMSIISCNKQHPNGQLQQQQQHHGNYELQQT